jgi:4-hydroxyacetophenone monooxygenase
MLEEGRTRVEVKEAAFRRYNEALDVEASQLLLMQPEGAPDKNYYLNEHGRMQVNAPWYGPEYHRMCTEVDWDDIEIS